jgi:hypothetical protein
MSVCNSVFLVVNYRYESTVNKIPIHLRDWKLRAPIFRLVTGMPQYPRQNSLEDVASINLCK